MYNDVFSIPKYKLKNRPLNAISYADDHNLKRVFYLLLFFPNYLLVGFKFKMVFLFEINCMNV